MKGKGLESNLERETIQYPDGRVELRDYASISSSPLYNKDLAPVPVAKRTWTTYNYAALWISMAHCIPTYMLSSGLISAGMNWWQALITILLGNTIVLIPILLNSHPGTKYGIPFPVFARAAYGTIGSNLPALMRAIVACGWFGIHVWIIIKGMDLLRRVENWAAPFVLVMAAALLWWAIKSAHGLGPLLADRGK